MPDSATGPERDAWAKAIGFYRAHYGTRSLLFDPELVRIKVQLAAAEQESLSRADLDQRHEAVMRSAASIYRRYWWDAHDAENRRFITSTEALLKRHGSSIASLVAGSFSSTWPARPIRTDIVVDAGAPGNAYTTNDPTHIVIGAGDSRHQGHSGLEILFHEASHGWDGILKAIS